MEEVTQKSFMLTRPFRHELKSNGDLLIKGDISSTDKDLVNDICTLHCLESMKSQIEDRNMKLDIEHEAFRGSSTEEKEINKTKIPAGRMYNPTIRKKSNGHALSVEAVINQHMDRFEEIKGSIVDKFLDAFSIAFIPTRTKTVVKDGEQVRMLDDVALLNVALTGNPVNTAAQMSEIVAKSIESIEEYKTAKLTNSDVENLLEVKSELKETGSDKEKRKLRKEAVDSDEDEEEKGCGKKYEKKSYEKDGAHVHGEKDPAGEHRHPEIEDKIDQLSDMVVMVSNMITSSPEEAKSIETKPFAGYENFAACVRANKNKKDPEAYCATIQRQVEGKSHSNENSNIIEKEVIKMEKTEIKDEIENVEEQKEEVAAVAEEPKTDVLSEVKAMIEAQNAQIASLKSIIESKDETVEVKEVKSNPKAMVSNENTQSLGIQAKSVAGLSELY